MICFSAVTHGEGSHHKQHHTRRSHPYLTHTRTHTHSSHTTRITSRPYIFFFFLFARSRCHRRRICIGQLEPTTQFVFLASIAPSSILLSTFLEQTVSYQFRPRCWLPKISQPADKYHLLSGHRGTSVREDALGDFPPSAGVGK